jgi:hypothetical protein
LVVLDSTPNPKLAELVKAFERCGGETYLGTAAWAHLESLAGGTMAQFLEKYVRGPLDQLLRHPPGQLPELRARAQGTNIQLALGSEKLTIARRSTAEVDEQSIDPMPDDTIDETAG